MGPGRSTLSDRQALWAFVLGCVAVTAGVLLHLPMFAMARTMDYQLAGMTMGRDMIFGMVLIVGGVLLAAWGVLPRGIAAHRAAGDAVAIIAPDDAMFGAPQIRLMLVLVIALIIDTMKPASLGFTVPGMVSEYGVPNAVVSLVPFFALMGTVVGSVVWGFLADIYGRKATILLSAVMFVGTSICGAMPSLAWNIGMCFMMGAAAGGMLPVTYALLAEMLPSRHRGWGMVLVGGLGAAGGYFAASGLSALLQPIFGWRILWLINLPTGLALILLGGAIPESAKFLIARGRIAEAEAVMRKFGGVARRVVREAKPATPGPVVGVGLAWQTVALSVTALAWGFVNFGLLLWLPADFVARGYSVGVSSKLLAESALIAFPTVFLAALLYGRWSTRGSLLLTIALTLIGLGGVLALELGAIDSPVLPVALLIIGANGTIAILLPYAAECFPLLIRGRATGWIAACTKAGGLLAQVLSIAALTPSLGLAAISIMAPSVFGLILLWMFGGETLGLDLQDLDGPGHLGEVLA
jgi:putative MFS transporter